MVAETNRTTEARRKALRKGDEDPVVVAQRFLNIYRQMHILSGERREAFNKMLLELSPDVKSIFSTLPGGAMLQDYIDELSGNKGSEEAVDTPSSPSPVFDTTTQATAFGAVPPSSSAQPVTAVSGKISFDKDFSTEFTRIIAGLLQQQAATQRESLEKIIKELGNNAAGGASSIGAGKVNISLGENFASDFAKSLHPLMQYQSQLQKESLDKLVQDISKTQLYIAKNIKEGYNEHQQEFKELCKVIADKTPVVTSSGGESISGIDIKELLQTISDNYLSIREDQNKEIKELCSAITEGLKSSRDNGSTSSEIKELCDAIIQSQKSLGQSLSGIKLADGTVAAPLPAYDDSTTQKLIEAVIEGQKQINLRLDKVEEMSLNKANDNINLIEAFKATQEELLKNLNNRSDSPSQSPSKEADSAKLLKMINDSQEKLIKAVISKVSENHTQPSSQGEHITPVAFSGDQEAIEKLINKISSLQASNEKNLEKAITRAIEAQGEIFGKLSNRKNEELIEAFTRGIKEILTPMLVTQIKQETTANIAQSDRFASSEVEKNIYEPQDITVSKDTYDNTFEDGNYADNVSDGAVTKKKKKKKKKKNTTAEINTGFEVANNEATQSLDAALELPNGEFDYEDLPEVSASTEQDHYDELQPNEYENSVDNNLDNSDAFGGTTETVALAENEPPSYDYTYQPEEPADTDPQTVPDEEVPHPDAGAVTSDETNSEYYISGDENNQEQSSDESSFDWGFSTQDDGNSELATSNIRISDDYEGEEANDWGFDASSNEDFSQNDEIVPQDEKYDYAPDNAAYPSDSDAGNDNSDQDWEWVYVEDDDNYSDDYMPEEVSGSDVNTTLPASPPQKLKLLQSEDEDFDPYQNSVLKD